MWLYFVDRKDQPTFINNTVYPTHEHAMTAALQVGRALDPEGQVHPLEDPTNKHRSTFLLFESPRIMVYLLRLCKVTNH
jgi:hypothetical protein